MASHNRILSGSFSLASFAVFFNDEYYLVLVYLLCVICSMSASGLLNLKTRQLLWAVLLCIVGLGTW